MYTHPAQEEGEQTQRHAPQPPAVINSLLVADCGTVCTKVSLFGLVEGQYRLMARGEAPTTVTPPQEDITAGIIQAIQRIEQITGRRFVENEQIISPEKNNGDGIDIFIATVSAGGPLRMVVLGAVSTTLEELARQAVSGLYVETEVIPASSFLSTAANTPVPVGVGQGFAQGVEGQWTKERIAKEWEQQLARMRELQPHVALIVGMADGPAGPRPLQEACQLLLNAAKSQERQGPPASPQYSVLYAAAPQYIEATRRMVSGVADVSRVEPLVSQAQLGAISVATSALHEWHVIQHIPGYQHMLSWSGSTPVATATSLSSLVRFLAQHYAMNVTAVDVGGMTTTVMVAGEKGEFLPKVNSGIGVGPGVGAILQQAGVQRIARWLPFAVTEEEIRQFVLNQIVHAQAIPTTPRELQICQAFAREAILLTMEELNRHAGEWLEPDLILGTGSVLAHAPSYGQAALILLDTLQPRGVVSLVIDRPMLITQLGAVATVAPVTAVQVNENDAVTHRLGTCVVPFGAIRPGQLALRIELEYSNGRQQQVDVMGGTIVVVPLRMDEQALLSLFPTAEVDVGLGLGERARAAEEIDGGLIGLIIDARGRPLILPTDNAERQARLRQWAQVLGA
jgi:hypothetical protein